MSYGKKVQDGGESAGSRRAPEQRFLIGLVLREGGTYDKVDEQKKKGRDPGGAGRPVKKKSIQES